MLTTNKISTFYADVERLKLKFPVAAISKETGISKGTVSDVLSKKREPSENFIDEFYLKFPKGNYIDKAEEDDETKNVLNDPETPYIKTPPEPLPIEAIIKLIDSNAMLAKSNADVSASNVVLAETNKRLADRVLSNTTVNEQQEILEAYHTRLQTLQELLLDVGTGKRFGSKEEIRALLNKAFAES